MKKIISTVLALVLVLTILAVPAFGADASGIKLSCSPSSFSLEEGSDSAVNVSLDLQNNPGLWSVRVFVVYPDGLSLDDGSGNAAVSNAGGVFSESDDMVCGTHDLALSDSRQIPAMKDIIEANKLETEGYRSACIYFESASLTSVTSKNGPLANLSFHLTDDAESGDVLDIRLYYGEYDFFYASINNAGKIAFKSYYPEVSGANVIVGECPHPDTYHTSLAPTCTENGYEREVCTQCGAVFEETVISAYGHDEKGKVVTVPSTCSVAGSMTYYCSCGDVARTESLPLASHTPDSPVTIDPTCTENGSITISCTECESVISTEVIASPGHDYDSVVVAPTRAEQGYTVHTCSVCGDTYKDSFTDPIGGDYDPGDANGDGNINAMDVNIARRFLSGAATADDAQLKACDLSGDGVVNAQDANLIARLVAGIL